MGPNIWGLGPLYIQGPKPRPRSPTAEYVWWKPPKGPKMWPRTISRLTPHKTLEENDKFSTGAGQGRKLPPPQCGALRLTSPYSRPCYSTFPNHSDVWIDRTSQYPKKAKLTRKQKTERRHWYKRGRGPGEKGILQKKEEWREDDAPWTKFEDSNPPSYTDVKPSYSSQTYLRMSFHENHD